MNGPSKCAMYKLRPAFTLPDPIELPKNMYKLNKLETSGEPQVDIVRGIQDKSSVGDASNLEKRWDLVLVQLADLKLQLADIKKTVEVVAKSNNCSLVVVKKSKAKVPNQLNILEGSVIKANPSSPPYSLLLIQRLYKEELNLKLLSHVHSTVKLLPDTIPQFSSPSSFANGTSQLNLLVIWKEGLLDTELVMNPIRQIAILGEVNILRHFARLGLESLRYDSDEITQLQNDSILDTCHRLLHVRTVKEKQSIIRSLNAKLGRNLYYGGNEINISDIAVWSAVKQTNLGSDKELSQNMAKWFSRVESMIE